ncbi:hypothetical protein KL946_003224 [Ogataea haglerorum]|uniref:Uncharacterized protein n=1 Tax=Ogataea haglerorum TaxID=1937702 RepID=A0ABQ7RF67_9ASCO|nr:hypothetical protein KL946_003224 [Ogataea haglerorum]
MNELQPSPVEAGLPRVCDPVDSLLVETAADELHADGQQDAAVLEGSQPAARDAHRRVARGAERPRVDGHAPALGHLLGRRRVGRRVPVRHVRRRRRDKDVALAQHRVVLVPQLSVQVGGLAVQLGVVLPGVQAGQQRELGRGKEAVELVLRERPELRDQQTPAATR